MEFLQRGPRHPSFSSSLAWEEMIFAVKDSPGYSLFPALDLNFKDACCRISGDVESRDAPKLEVLLADWLERREGAAILDIRDVSYLPIDGIKMLCRLRLNAARRGAFPILLTNPYQDRIFKILHLNSFFIVANTFGEAIRLLPQRSI